MDAQLLPRIIVVLSDLRLYFGKRVTQMLAHNRFQQIMFRMIRFVEIDYGIIDRLVRFAQLVVNLHPEAISLLVIGIVFFAYIG